MHQQIDQKSEQNEWRVLESYRKHRVSDSHFNPTTGYGYDDMGRDTLEKIYADVLGEKAASCVRRSFPVHMRSPLHYLVC